MSHIVQTRGPAMLRQQINRGGVEHEPLQQLDFKTSSSIHEAAGELQNFWGCAIRDFFGGCFH